MPLKAYVRPRLVILAPEASALDAARAIESNNIGPVVVQDQGQVVGIAEYGRRARHRAASAARAAGGAHRLAAAVAGARDGARGRAVAL